MLLCQPVCHELQDQRDDNEILLQMIAGLSRIATFTSENEGPQPVATCSVWPCGCLSNYSDTIFFCQNGSVHCTRSWIIKISYKSCNFLFLATAVLVSDVCGCVLRLSCTVSRNFLETKCLPAFSRYHKPEFYFRLKNSIFLGCTVYKMLKSVFYTRDLCAFILLYMFHRGRTTTALPTLLGNNYTAHTLCQLV